MLSERSQAHRNHTNCMTAYEVQEQAKLIYDFDERQSIGFLWGVEH